MQGVFLGSNLNKAQGFVVPGDDVNLAVPALYVPANDLIPRNSQVFGRQLFSPSASMDAFSLQWLPFSVAQSCAGKKKRRHSYEHRRFRIGCTEAAINSCWPRYDDGYHAHADEPSYLRVHASSKAWRDEHGRGE